MAFFGIAKKSKLGIDIGTSAVKLVELSKDSGRFKLENYGLFELDSGGEQVSEQDLIGGIRETLKKTKISARDTVASIPSFNTFATIITLPYLSEADIAKTIPYEARKYIPLPLNEVVLDWSIIGVTGQKTGLGREGMLSARTPSAGSPPPAVDVYIAAVPKEETQRYHAIMKE